MPGTSEHFYAFDCCFKHRRVFIEDASLTALNEFTKLIPLLNERGYKVATIKHDGLDLMRFFPEADIILIEGMKNSKYPKYVCDYPNIIPDELAVLEDILSQSKSKTSDIISDSVPSAL